MATTSADVAPSSAGDEAAAAPVVESKAGEAKAGDHPLETPWSIWYALVLPLADCTFFSPEPFLCISRVRQKV